MKHDQRTYYAALGKHITYLRKHLGMTQADLARSIGVSQQAVFAYELGDRRPSAFLVLKIARVLKTTPDQLLAFVPTRPHGNLKVSPRTLRYAERIEALPKTQQRFVTRIIDTLQPAGV